MNSAGESKPNINDLTPAQRREYMRRVYHRQSRFQEKFGSDSVELNCAKHFEILRGEVSRLLIEKRIVSQNVPLEQLHEHVDQELKDYNFDDGVNKISTYFYDTDERFLSAYKAFVKEVLHNSVFGMPMWYQSTPTIRIHCPDGKNANHYPRYHTDIGYGHPPEEINVWLPLTAKLEGHSFRVAPVESSRELYAQKNFDVHDFIDSAIHDPVFSKTCEDAAAPVETDHGKVLLFDSRCVHSGEPLKAHTRVSIDMRVVPLVDFDRSEYLFQGTGRRRIIFGPGHCYSDVSTENLNP